MPQPVGPPHVGKREDLLRENKALHKQINALTTELADFLAAHGVPFREAHHVAGGLVKLCEDNGQTLADLTLNDLQNAHPAFTADALTWLDPEAAVERRTSRGGTAWVEIERQLALLRQG